MEDKKMKDEKPVMLRSLSAVFCLCYVVCCLNPGDIMGELGIRFFHDPVLSLLFRVSLLSFLSIPSLLSSSRSQ